MKSEVTFSRRLFLLKSAVAVLLFGSGCLDSIRGKETIRFGEMTISNYHTSSHDVSIEVRNESETFVDETYQLDANDESTPAVPWVEVEPIPDEPGHYTIIARAGEQTERTTMPNDIASGECGTVEARIRRSGDLTFYVSESCDGVDATDDSES